ncbi:hypothetical protein ACTU44_21910 (plasmid) [Thalassospira sp. SM2505]
MHNVTANDISKANTISLAFNAAIRANDAGAFKIASDAYDALIEATNGDRGRFACFSDNGSGTVFAQELAAKPGQIPHWGQNGVFLIDTPHGRALVKFTCPLDSCRGFSFYVVDFGMPFISETGYRFHHYHDYPPLSVEETAVSIFCAYADKEGLVDIENDYRNKRSLPDFVTQSNPDFQGVPVRTKTNGQMGFAF